MEALVTILDNMVGIFCVGFTIVFLIFALMQLLKRNKNG